MRLTIAIANHKGGTAKTTTAWHMADAFARRGLRPAMIDLDPQGNLTTRSRVLTNGCTIGDVLGGAAPATCALRQALLAVDAMDGAQIAPATVTLENVAAGLTQRTFGRLTAFSAAIERGHLNRPILIDCPPNLGVLTLNALVAADAVIIPTELMPDSLAGVRNIMQTVAQIGAELGKAPVILGTIAVKVEAHLVAHRDNLAAMNPHAYPRMIGSVQKRSGMDAEQHLVEAYDVIAGDVLARLEEDPKC